MRSMRQLLRQPLRTLSGILLTALAVAVLCISFAQTLAAANTAAKLKETFMTVALPGEMADGDAAAWIDTVVSEHPDIILEDARHGLASAYIPALDQDNLTAHLYETEHLNENYTLEPDSPVYAGTMLEITLTDIETVENSLYGTEVRYRPSSDGKYISTEPMPYNEGYSIHLLGTIDRVLGLEAGYHDPTGYQVSIYLHVADNKVFEDMALAVGERYLVYSDSYLDLDWIERSWLLNTGRVLMWEEGVEVPYWEMDTLRSEEKVQVNYSFDEFGNIQREEELVTFYKCRLGDLHHGIQGSEVYMFRTIELTVEDKASIPLTVSYYTLEGEEMVEHREFLEIYTYTDENGDEATMTIEDYKERYSIPSIVPLESTAEMFLASEAGADWKQALDDIEINSHAFPVIGVDDLNYIADFVCGKAKIAEGRSFTEEELESGAKVCVLSKSLAEANGLGVGDTISASFFTYDFANPYQEFIHNGDGIVNPTAYCYYSETMALGAEERYTIVGLYEQYNPWGSVDNNLYQFTPNTIFAPKASIPGSMDYSSQGMFRSLVLDGDRLYDLQIMTVEAGMDGIFYYYDNGYVNLASSLKGYQEAAEQMLPLGITVYAVLALLYLFLFPGRQGKDLAMMDSFGATKGQMVRHVLTGAAGILIPGGVLGTGVSLALWQYVSEALKAFVETDITVELEVWNLWAVALVQAIILLAAAGVLGNVMARRVNVMKRK